VYATRSQGILVLSTYRANFYRILVVEQFATARTLRAFDFTRRSSEACR